MLLEGKRVLVTGVLTDQLHRLLGGPVRPGAGRGDRAHLVRPGHEPDQAGGPAPADRTRRPRARRHRSRAPRGRSAPSSSSAGAASTGSSTPSASPPRACLGGDFLRAGWDDVATAVHVSAYSLKALAEMALPLMKGAGQGTGGAAAPSWASTSTPPWPGRPTTGWAWPRRPWSRPPATWPGTSARPASGSTWWPPARCGPWRPSRSPASRIRGGLGGPGPAGLVDHRSRARRPGLRRPAVGLVPRHHRRDHPRRRRLPRHRGLAP